MLKTALKMLKENSLCVLSTCSGNLPNSSLMHYIVDDTGKNIFMLTLGDSVKYNNIKANPQVSLLVDTRADVPRAGLPVMALTAYGKASIVDDLQRHQTIVEQMAARYSNLEQLASDSRCMVIQVNIEKILLLDGVNDKSLYLLK